MTDLVYNHWMLIFNSVLTLINILIFVGLVIHEATNKIDSVNPEFDFSIITEDDLQELARVMNASPIEPKRPL